MVVRWDAKTMQRNDERFDPSVRAREKQVSREADERDLRAGPKVRRAAAPRERVSRAVRTAVAG